MRSAGNPDASYPADWGVGTLGMNKLGRVRMSTAVGYLGPARIRDNLEVIADTTTRRVIVEGGLAVGCSGGDVRSPRRVGL